MDFLEKSNKLGAFQVALMVKILRVNAADIKDMGSIHELWILSQTSSLNFTETEMAPVVGRESYS